MKNLDVDAVTEDKSCSSECADEKKVSLKRRVGFTGAVSLIVGTIIGSGIFISPKGVFYNAGSIGLGLVIWLGCGVFSILGALCYCEMGTMIPKSGGEYPIFLEAFGPIPAYLFAWTCTVILKPSSFALLSLTFAEYALTPAYGDCDSVPEIASKLVAGTLILFVVFVNCASVRATTRIVTVFGVGKVLSLVIIIVGGIVRLAQGHTENFDNAFESSNSPGLRELTLAFYQGLWAVDGWNQLNYIVEELKDPYRTLPRSIIVSMIIVTSLYVFTNVSYFTAMTFEQMLASPAVAATLLYNDFHESLTNLRFKTYGHVVLGVFVWAIPIAVACSVFGTCVGSCFTAGRISYCAAREGHFTLILSMIHVTKFTPAPAVILNGFIAMLMLIPNNFDSLIQYYSFVQWGLYCTTAVALLWFRYKMPNRHRPVKIPIIIAIIFALFSFCLVLFPIIDDPQIQYLVAVCSMLFGFVFYIPFVHYNVQSKTIRSFNVFLQKLLNVSFPETEKDFSPK